MFIIEIKIINAEGEVIKCQCQVDEFTRPWGLLSQDPIKQLARSIADQLAAMDKKPMSTGRGQKRVEV